MRFCGKDLISLREKVQHFFSVRIRIKIKWILNVCNISYDKGRNINDINDLKLLKKTPINVQEVPVCDSATSYVYPRTARNINQEWR